MIKKNFSLTVYQRNFSLIQRNSFLSVSSKFSGRYFIYEKNDDVHEYELIEETGISSYIDAESGFTYLLWFWWYIYKNSGVDVSKSESAVHWENSFFESKKHFYDVRSKE